MEEYLKPNILYVDDEIDNLVVFKSAFRRYYNIITATSGTEALSVFEKEPIALVITDQRMPQMTGIELLKSLPEQPESIRMVLTGFSDVTAIIEAINSGKVYKYITKPWDKNDLKVTIDNAIEALELRMNNRHLIQELKEANESLEKKVIERTAKIQQQKEEIESQKIELEKEKDKANSLLLNILPYEIAEELKLRGKAMARKYNEVGVLFSDFKDFTIISEKLDPQVILSELDYCFQAFDDIVEKYGLEKIKTIGDSYMCTGGLPAMDKFSSQKLVMAALDMQAFLVNHKKINPNDHLTQLRIGINTGPVIAGVVGKLKFAYDVWGDTVNTAARLESHGEPGKINISRATYDLIKDDFNCTYRGKINVKGKGELEMYFVDGSK